MKAEIKIPDGYKLLEGTELHSTRHDDLYLCRDRWKKVGDGNEDLSACLHIRPISSKREPVAPPNTLIVVYKKTGHIHTINCATHSGVFMCGFGNRKIPYSELTEQFTTIDGKQIGREVAQ